MANNFTVNGIREIDYKLDPPLVEALRSAWQGYTNTIKPYPSQDFSGRGIVMCAGGLRYFTCSWVAIHMLRRSGCTLPIEIWYKGNELSKEVISALGDLQVVCRDFLDYPSASWSGYMLKPLAILKSRFKEVLFLDSDNICIQDPTVLFSSAAYKQYGTLFWPDYWSTSSDNPIWDIINCVPDDSPEQESGQLLIDKERCWRELHLCMFFNKHQKYYYRLLLGDKDTFRFAWKALRREFFMIPYATGSCGYMGEDNKFYGTTMLQYDLSGVPLFLHRNLLKWDVTRSSERVWRYMKRFHPTATHRSYHMGYSSNGHFYVDLDGDITLSDFVAQFGDFEACCLATLDALRASDFYQRFITYAHYASNRYIQSEKFDLI